MASMARVRRELIIKDKVQPDHVDTLHCSYCTNAIMHYIPCYLRTKFIRMPSLKVVLILLIFWNVYIAIILVLRWHLKCHLIIFSVYYSTLLSLLYYYYGDKPTNSIFTQWILTKLGT